jgi:hypothetical protein
MYCFCFHFKIPFLLSNQEDFHFLSLFVIKVFSLFDFLVCHLFVYFSKVFSFNEEIRQSYQHPIHIGVHPN